MSDDKDTQPSKKDAELEREILAQRKFSLSEAIGRMAGPGMMKGESPVTLKRQAEAVIDGYLGQHLIDAGGALGAVLSRAVRESAALLANYDQPLAALAIVIQHILESEYLLKELVRLADVEWGQMTGERPYFEREGCPADPNDPYTVESVRSTLSQLFDKLVARAR